jgi:hypothetical protein
MSTAPSSTSSSPSAKQKSSQPGDKPEVHISEEELGVTQGPEPDDGGGGTDE